MDNSTNHNCVDTIAKVILSLDGGLTEAEEKEFIKDVNCCNHCLEKYNIEKSFKLFIQQKVSKNKVDISIIEKIKLSIKNKI